MLVRIDQDAARALPTILLECGKGIERFEHVQQTQIRRPRRDKL